MPRQSALSSDSSEVSPSAPLPSRKTLEAKWQAAFGRPLSRKTSRPLAAHLLLCHAQDVACGGLSPEAAAYLAKLAPKGSGGVAAPPSKARRLKPGTRLVRSWRGQTYIVTVADPGFIFEDRPYRSLSVIAREITGTPWSGPAFFGLKGGTAKAGAR
jgi:hypothetical protein